MSNNNDILILSKSNIDTLLSQGDPKVANDIIDLMSTTFQQYTQSHSCPSNKVQSPQRIGVDTDSHRVLYMPSRLNTTTSIKIVSVPTKEGVSGLPATILVMNEETGAVEAVLNAGALTAVRTAAGSGLATRYYANPQAKNLVVFGAGAQGRAHVDMMIAARPTVNHIAIWNRGKERRTALIDELQKAYPDRAFVSANENLEQEVAQADIVCTCTNAVEPVLFGKWLKEGAHLNCVGSYRMDMHEVDADTVKRAEIIVVDSKSACGHEAGELVKSSDPKNWVEIGQMVQDKISEETLEKDRKKITLFKSVGISLQDSAIAGLMVKYAKEKNMGNQVPY